MKNKLKYLFVLSSLFVLLMCSSVFARGTATPYSGTLSNGSSFVINEFCYLGYFEGNLHIYKPGFSYVPYYIRGGGPYYIQLDSNGLGNFPVSGVMNPSVEVIPTEYHTTTAKILEWFQGEDITPEKFDPYALSTEEGLEEFGYVYNWGNDSSIINTYSMTDPTDSISPKPIITKDPFGFRTYMSGIRQNKISFHKSDDNNNDLGLIPTTEYDELFVEFCYRGTSSVTITNNDRMTGGGVKSVLVPYSNNEFPFLPYGEGENINDNFYTFFDFLKLKEIYFSPELVNRAIFNYQNDHLGDDIPDIFRYGYGYDPSLLDTPNQDDLFDNFRQYFSNDFYLGARYVGLKDGHWIYGPYKYDYFYISGNNINLVPDNPEKTINTIKGQVIYSEPTSDPDVFTEITKDSDDTKVYYNNEPSFTFSPTLPDNNNNYDSSDANIIINNINGNLVNEDLLNDNTLDTNKLQKWTSELVESVKNVPLALKDLFLFFPNWVLNLFVVSFGLLIIFRLLK